MATVPDVEMPESTTNTERSAWPAVERADVELT